MCSFTFTVAGATIPTHYYHAMKTSSFKPPSVGAMTQPFCFNLRDSGQRKNPA